MKNRTIDIINAVLRFFDSNTRLVKLPAQQDNHLTKEYELEDTFKYGDYVELGDEYWKKYHKLRVKING